MMHFIKKYIVFASVILALLMVVAACASIASPTGGEIDYDPPKIVSTNPALGAVDVKKGKVTIIFDENITVEKPSENVIVTPPQNTLPIIQAVNRKLTVELKDSLIPDMTYTIDFTSSIVDNNEKNPLENFAFSFSTGKTVDSLSISGKVLNAQDLEPIKGIYVGLHSNMTDTAFTKIKFERISRTNESGEFSIKGVAPGKYKIYALDDMNRDYMYDNPAEAVAFMETVIEPASEKATRMDTTFVDDTKKAIDTVKTVEFTRFIPDNILLRVFKSDFKRQYLQKHERLANKLMLYFGAPTPMPKLEPLSFDPKQNWSILEKSAKNDTLVYWIKDSLISKIDTLSFQVSYFKSDSLNQPQLVTDTLKFIDRSAKAKEKLDKKEDKKKKKKGEEEEREPYLEIKNNLNASWDPRKDILLEFSEPIKDSLRSKISLVHFKDTVSKPIQYKLEIDSLNPRKCTISYKWQYDNTYQISIDSASIYSVYGLANDKILQKFTVKKQDQYAQLAFKIHGIDSIPAFVELLNKEDKPVRRVKVSSDRFALFKDLDPGSYYARIILDANDNGIWDTGDYSKGLQPEMVCYNSNVFEMKAFFELLQDWVIDTSNLANQKPMDITKQKPEDKEAKRKKREGQEQQKRDQEQRNNRTNANTSRRQETSSGYNPTFPN